MLLQAALILRLDIGLFSYCYNFILKKQMVHLGFINTEPAYSGYVYGFVHIAAYGVLFKQVCCISSSRV